MADDNEARCWAQLKPVSEPTKYFMAVLNLTYNEISETNAVTDTFVIWKSALLIGFGINAVLQS